MSLCDSSLVATGAPSSCSYDRGFFCYFDCTFIRPQQTSAAEGAVSQAAKMAAPIVSYGPKFCRSNARARKNGTRRRARAPFFVSPGGPGFVLEIARRKKEPFGANVPPK